MQRKLRGPDGAWPSEGTLWIAAFAGMAGQMRRLPRLTLARLGEWLAMTGSVVGKGRHRGLPLRPVLFNQVAARPANLAPMAKAFSQSMGNTVR